MPARRRHTRHHRLRRESHAVAMTAAVMLALPAPARAQDQGPIRIDAAPQTPEPAASRRQPEPARTARGPIVIPQIDLTRTGAAPDAGDRRPADPIAGRPPDAPAPAGSRAIVRRGRDVDGNLAAPAPRGEFFGTPEAGLLPAACSIGPGGLRTADIPRRCLDALAFVVSPPPAARTVLPRNLPPIAPADARPPPTVLANRPPAPPPIRQAPPAEPQPAPVEGDPYEPRGITAGGFLLKPALDVGTGYDSNPGRVPQGRGSAFATVAPSLLVRSQFDRHLLNADLRVAYVDYVNARQLDRTAVDAKVNGRYDLSDTTALNAESHLMLDADDPGTPRFTGRFARIPLVNTIGGSAGFTRKFEQVEISAKAAYDHVQFQNARLVDGQIVSNRDRMFDQTGGQARITYNLSPEFRPFIDVAVDRRVHAQQIDVDGFRRNSVGTAVEAGMTFALTDRLTGDVAAGYLVRRYEDPLLKPVSGFIIDANLNWQFLKETALLFAARSQVAEITEPGISGVLRRDVVAGIEHQFQPWLTGTLQAGYGQDVFTGSTRVDDRYLVELGLLYKMSRLLQLRAGIRHEATRSNVPINDFSATVVQVGARVQY